LAELRTAINQGQLVLHDQPKQTGLIRPLTSFVVTEALGALRRPTGRAPSDTGR
jgi:hypothetical protein